MSDLETYYIFIREPWEIKFSCHVVLSTKRDI